MHHGWGKTGKPCVVYVICNIPVCSTNEAEIRIALSIYVWSSEGKVRLMGAHFGFYLNDGRKLTYEYFFTPGYSKIPVNRTEAELPVSIRHRSTGGEFPIAPNAGTSVSGLDISIVG